MEKVVQNNIALHAFDFDISFQEMLQCTSVCNHMIQPNHCLLEENSDRDLQYQETVPFSCTFFLRVKETVTLCLVRVS